MCTLVVAWQALDDAPVAVAANRDESLDRPASPPSVIDGDPAIVAPRDEEAGGTWIGYNDRGLFVGLSNRPAADDRPGERSRGRLVLDLLSATSADAASSGVEEAVRSSRYAPFNLVAADAEAAVVSAWDGRLRVDELDPGVHVVRNAGWDDRFDAVGGGESLAAEQAAGARQLRERLAVRSGEPAAGWLDRAAEALADHELGVCVHRDGYGTRSSSLIAIREDGSATYRYADGPPCRTDFAPVDGQI
ncbi:MAG: NRDE family protein [Halobacteriales archaeon]